MFIYVFTIRKDRMLQILHEKHLNNWILYKMNITVLKYSTCVIGYICMFITLIQRATFKSKLLILWLYHKPLGLQRSQQKKNDCISQDPTAVMGLGYYPSTGRAGFYCFHRCYVERESVWTRKLMTEGYRDKERGWGRRKKNADTCMKEQQVDWTGTWITDEHLF